MLATPPGASGSSGQASPSLSTPTSSPREGVYVRVQQALLETRLKVCVVQRVSFALARLHYIC